jgi:hypothetical protein
VGLAVQRDCVRLVQSEEYPSGKFSNVVARWRFLLPVPSGKEEHIGNENGFGYDHVAGRRDQEVDETV